MSMTRNKVEAAVTEARRFIRAADGALAQLDLEEQRRDDWHDHRERLGADGPRPAPVSSACDYSYGSRQTGALRRASLDLTRNLAELRNERAHQSSDQVALPRPHDTNSRERPRENPGRRRPRSRPNRGGFTHSGGRMKLTDNANDIELADPDEGAIITDVVILRKSVIHGDDGNLLDSILIGKSCQTTRTLQVAMIEAARKTVNVWDEAVE